ncbi:DHS-like NAD/FAD-binding domain-containing protein [Immersiella caudata]|uniref:DHS-like NAD/FAD-binding domain-containing protein n=1 Tax=Immersiella caudata TaxID=314043 RepID=A0AA40BXC7_9PEZI|nr:DHS-like NAD/FAD-binding domain-containing protein [Immersiella caudata]
MAPPKNYNSIPAFHAKLQSARRILAVCGAGLSAASGLPTFRGPGGLWRNHQATDLATPEAFEDDPGLVWLFYAYRRHMALNVKPNPGHHALAALAEKVPGFLCLSQNVDGLHPRAGHPPEQLRLLHGSLFDIKCNACGWIQKDNYDDPFCPALAAAAEDVNPGETLPLLDPSKELADIPRQEIPPCPQCDRGLQRPGVVWFGEPLDEDMLNEVDSWIDEGEVDIVLVIGTSSQVYPAAGYAEQARGRETSVVTINLDAEDEVRRLRSNDFAFAGDAAVLLPKLLEPIIGTPVTDGTYA